MPATPPRFCIVTPSYNTGRYVGAAVQSVLDQDWPQVDYFVMDGGSTDGTVGVLKSFGPRLQWVSQKDAGQSDAINRGFARVGRGEPDEVLGWLNSDDTYAPGAFRAVADFFTAHPEVDLVYGDATYTDPAGRHIARCVHVEPYSKHRLFLYGDYIVQPAAFFRRRAFDAVGGIDASIHWAMDYDLWLRMAAAGAKFAYLPKVLANFRWLVENKTATGAWGRLDEIVSILRRQGHGPPAYIQLERCRQHAADAVGALRRRRFRHAARALTRGARDLVTSPRALASVFSPHVWHVIWVGQVLRARSAAAQRRAAAGNRDASALTSPPA